MEWGDEQRNGCGLRCSFPAQAADCDPVSHVPQGCSATHPFSTRTGLLPPCPVSASTSVLTCHSLIDASEQCTAIARATCLAMQCKLLFHNGFVLVAAFFVCVRRLRCYCLPTQLVTRVYHFRLPRSAHPTPRSPYVHIGRSTRRVHLCLRTVQPSRMPLSAFSSARPSPGKLPEDSNRCLHTVTCDRMQAAISGAPECKDPIC
jgi:hypothetical protein